MGWKKSSYSGGAGMCVEVARGDGNGGGPEGTTSIRHSLRPDEGVITYTNAEWGAFVAGVKAGEFD